MISERPATAPTSRWKFTAKRRDELLTIDRFCGAGGFAEGFLGEGYRCLYGNDVMPEAIQTFALNHPGAVADCRPIEDVSAAEIRDRLRLAP